MDRYECIMSVSNMDNVCAQILVSTDYLLTWVKSAHMTSDIAGKVVAHSDFTNRKRSEVQILDESFDFVNVFFAKYMDVII